MADMYTKEQRSKNMRAIRSTGSSLESKVTKELWNKVFRFRKNVRKLMGNPDISIQKYKTVIFIDSCFWHSCPIHGKKPSSNVEYWEKKLLRNVDRDNDVNHYHSKSGWFVLRVWEHEFKNDFDGTMEKITNFIKQAKKINKAANSNLGDLYGFIAAGKFYNTNKRQESITAIFTICEGMKRHAIGSQ